MPGTLYISDLDGTLLNSDASLSAQSVDLLNHAIARGALFTIATARTPATVDVIMQHVHMNLPAIVLTGAAWWDCKNKTYSNVRFIPPNHVTRINNIFLNHRITPFIYTLPPTETPNKLCVYYNNVSPTQIDADFIQQRINLPLKTFHIGQSLPEDRYDTTLIFFATGSYKTINKIARDIVKDTNCAVTCYDDIYHPGTGIVEVFAPGVSKAEAILQLKKQYQSEDIIVFGDNTNDLPMFDVADTAIAVANATEPVKAKARYVIGPNTDNAVATYINNHT